jgi:hypothetical protein
MPVQDLPSQGLLRWLLQRHLLAMVPGATLLDVACAVGVLADAGPRHASGRVGLAAVVAAGGWSACKGALSGHVSPGVVAGRRRLCNPSAMCTGSIVTSAGWYHRCLSRSHWIVVWKP